MCNNSKNTCDVQECQTFCENESTCNYLLSNERGVCRLYETCDQFTDSSYAGVIMQKVQGIFNKS